MHQPQVRQQAKALYQQHGAAYAAEQTGVPERTIRRWALEDGWQRMTVVAGQDAQTKSAASQAAMIG